MADEVDLAVPSSPFDDSDRTDGPVHSIGRGNVIAIRGPRTTSEVCRKRRALERRANRSLEDKVVNHVMLSRVGRRRGKSENLDGTIVASGRKELVSRVKGNTLDVTLVGGQCLELLKGMAGPDDHLGIEADGDEDRGVVGPCEVLDIIVVANQALVRLPILNRRFLVGAKRCRRRAFVEMVHTDDLVVGAAGKVASVGGESNRVNRAKVMAHMAKLTWLIVVGVVGIVDSFG